MADSKAQPKGRYIHKYILVGNIAVGKTVAAKSFADGKPNTTTQYKMTIGVDYAMRDVPMDDSIASIQIWDIAGEQRFGTMTKTYFRGANAVIIMFDLTNRVSWEDVDIWRQDVQNKLGIGSGSDRIPILIVGNKRDLITTDQPAVVTNEQLQEYVEHHNLWKGIMVSVRTDTIFGDTVLELASVVHKNLPARFSSAASAPKKDPRISTLVAIPPKRTPSGNISLKRLNSSGKSTSNVKSTKPSGEDGGDDDFVYTHTEEEGEEDGKGCCRLS